MKFGAPEKPLPIRQRRTLVALLRAWWSGNIPTHAELAEHLGFSCTSDVSRVVWALQRKGLVHLPLRARHIRLTPEGIREGLPYVNDDDLTQLLASLDERLELLRGEVARRVAFEAGREV